MNKFNPGEMYEKDGALLLILTRKDSGLGVIACRVCVLPYKNDFLNRRKYVPYDTTFYEKTTSWKLVKP